jgi:3-hydroxybutyryl-CoA dehydrogenase
VSCWARGSGVKEESFEVAKSGFQKIAVVGAGQMGAGIAQVAAQSGFQVTVFDAFPGALERAQGVMKKSLEKLKEKAQIQEEPAAILARVSFAKELRDVSAAKPELVIEAVSENFELKSKLFRELDQALPANTILASNTSSISITKLAATTSRPERFAGMHFMNPVPLMKLVELIRGLATSNEAFSRVEAAAQEMGKTTIVSKDVPGFVVNRILMPMINEAVYALSEGLATKEDIDAGMKLGTNQPMGPLTLADFIGLDTCLAIMNVLHEGLGDTKYRASPLLKQYVDAGWLGRKTKRGFYIYE